MSKYKMNDGTVVNTAKASVVYTEGIRWNGSNNISLATGSQWAHETLYRSAKGRYYIEYTSDYQNSAPMATWVKDEEAAAWLLLNEHDIPDDLADAAAAIEE